MPDSAIPPEPSQAQSPRPFLSTPPGLITGGLLLMVLSFAISCAITIFIASNDTLVQVVEDPETGTQNVDRTGMIIGAYVGYTLPILIAFGGAAMLIIGAIRWGVYGKNSVGAPWNKSQVSLLTSINERLLLSETAKRIAYRHEDVNLLRETIRDDIQKKEFDAALVLVNEIATTYGHKEEAEEYREEILSARTVEMDQKIERALNKLDETLAKHDFETASKEALKIQRLYPDSPRVREVHRKVTHAREQYKHDLEREFLEAAKVDDVDRAMELLKELDKYLTEQEAEQFREVARGVIGKKRENLGVQFKIAVHDREWLRAVAVGEQVIREFPNTRMADEVRSMLDLLRERAAGQRAAASRSGDHKNRAADQAATPGS
ncbi:MAG: hypothetical protein AAGC44_07685 [Planctomycetota bacterium]